MNIEEAKKKSYAISGGGHRIEDPIRFVSRLTSARRAVNEIKVPQDSVYMYDDGFQLIDNYYRSADPYECDEEAEDDAGVTKMAENELLNSLLEKDPTLINHIYFRKNISPKTFARLKAKDDQADKSNFLGKRSIILKASEDRDIPITRPKYCDPLTGAYYNTVEEFKKIRQLYALDEKRKIEKSNHYLSVLNSVKNKKLLHLLTETD